MTTTLVTAYYMIKSNKRRPPEEILENSKKTMRIEQPMIIFCEQDMYKTIYELRKGLLSKTFIYVLPFDELLFSKFLPEFENAKNCSDRNNYVHIICISKFEFLKRAIELNFFGTTHFAWIDFNLLGKSPHNSKNFQSDEIYTLINKICARPRNLFTIQVINCWTLKDYENLDNFFSQYRWITSGMFFTTDIHTGNFILSKLIKKTCKLSARGFGHAEESIFAFIIDKYPRYFNLTIGDYQDTIHNYYEITTNEEYIHQIVYNYKAQNRLGLIVKILKDSGNKSFKSKYL